ncbi:hypothetical protein [Flavobacterium gelatinilyticum]|uniref:hypothetical protein n=1 Tax=Flavobacterium gelatinilyticum TaxID=3003260 RepID=UPI00248038EF|nr:hypothetical protein [Flavobacterium gelatinilyticum]
MTKILLFVTALLSVNGFCQSIAAPQGLVEEKFSSPQIHLLKQFADHPVDLSKGLVDITIPIYNILFANKTIPINLMFHASGLKADASEDGMLGLKWALNIGGFISREVRGYPDEIKNHKQGINNSSYAPDWMTLYGGSAHKGYFNNNRVYQNDGLQYIGMSGVGKYEDTEYDIFTFSLPNGQSGKFILKDNDGNKSASFIPYKPYKLNNPLIENGSGSPDKNRFAKFEIIDDEGYIYSFGKNDSNVNYYENSPNYEYINCWLLTSITSPNKKDIIKFEYNFNRAYLNSLLTPVLINDQLDEFLNYYNQLECPDAWRDSPLFSATKSQLYYTYNYFIKNYNMPPLIDKEAFYLSKITYNDFVADFTYAGHLNVKLNGIKISKNNRILKKVQFNIERFPYEPNSYEKPSYLKSVGFLDNTDKIIEKYSFDYYHLDRLPTVDKLSHRADYWGYYNSEVENVILKDTVDIYWMPPSCRGAVQQRYRNEIGSGSNRYSNAEDMKIGMLKSITYPTGGTTTFEYSGNQYKDNNIIRDCGGLRITGTIEKDKNGNILKKRKFKYGENEDGIGEIPNYLKPDPNIRNFFEETAITYYIRDTNIYWSNPQTPFLPLDQGEGTYRTRYFTGFFPGKFYTFLYNLVAYNKVTEYIGDESNNIGKIENYYQSNIPLQNDYEFDTRNFKFQREKLTIDPSNFWNGNHINKKIEYKSGQNGLYSVVKQTDYFYTEKITEELYDLSIFRFKDFISYDINGGKESVETAVVELERVRQNPGSFFGHKVQKYIVGVENLSSIKEEFFLDGKSLIQTTTNSFDPNKPTFIKETITSTSKGENLIQKFLYPFNINTGVYSQMSDANVISPVIEKISLKNDKVISSTLLSYKKSDTNFVPHQNSITELNIPFSYSGFTNFNGSAKDIHYSSDPEITYDLYDDYGNPTQITSKGKATVCYIWGYDKKYPIAKIENATYTAGQTNSITAAQQILINNAVIASANENTQTSETALIAKLKLLREGFPNSIVTTYTYDPLIGITSVTDPKEYTTYYEYDTYGRLKQVKDNDQKILSANKYNYTN